MLEEKIEVFGKQGLSDIYGVESIEAPFYARLLASMVNHYQQTLTS